jgi:hypothetical protein
MMEPRLIAEVIRWTPRPSGRVPSRQCRHNPAEIRHSEMRMLADPAVRISAPKMNISVGMSSSPPGMSSEEFDRRVVASYNATPDVLKRYSNIGQVRWTGGANSNNAATTYLNQAGITNSQVNFYQSELSFKNGKIIPGLGQSALAPTYSASAQQTYNAIAGFFSRV